MTEFSRYAVYYAPRPGDFATAAAQWIGRCPETGMACDQPITPGLSGALAAFTSKPRKYGFHGTIRAPFRLAEGETEESVIATVAALAASLPPTSCDALNVQNRYGFGLALTPAGDEAEIVSLGMKVVEGTNHLRAPLSAREIAKREAEGMTPRQRELMERWGYPRVMEELSFQLTLTNRTTPEVELILSRAIESHFDQKVPMPFMIEDLCLFGEEADTGDFRLLQRFRLKA